MLLFVIFLMEHIPAANDFGDLLQRAATVFPAGCQLVLPGTMGRSQVVRHRILVPAFGGSNPPAPANLIATGAAFRK